MEGGSDAVSLQGEAATSPDDLGAGDIMDILMEVPGVETAPTAWWQSM